MPLSWTASQASTAVFVLARSLADGFDGLVTSGRLAPTSYVSHALLNLIGDVLLMLHDGAMPVQGSTTQDTARQYHRLDAAIEASSCEMVCSAK